MVDPSPLTMSFARLLTRTLLQRLHSSACRAKLIPPVFSMVRTQLVTLPTNSSGVATTIAFGAPSFGSGTPLSTDTLPPSVTLTARHMPGTVLHSGG